MFKSILPSRRVPSGDFTVLTNLMEDASGKENLPTQMHSGKPRMVTKPVEKEKKKKGDSKKGKDVPTEIIVSPQAFDKLLVSLRSYSTMARSFKCHYRTISKFLHR